MAVCTTRCKPSVGAGACRGCRALLAGGSTRRTAGVAAGVAAATVLAAAVLAAAVLASATAAAAVLAATVLLPPCWLLAVLSVRGAAARASGGAGPRAPLPAWLAVRLGGAPDVKPTAASVSVAVGP